MLYKRNKIIFTIVLVFTLFFSVVFQIMSYLDNNELESLYISTGKEEASFGIENMGYDKAKKLLEKNFVEDGYIQVLNSSDEYSSINGRDALRVFESEVTPNFFDFNRMFFKGELKNDGVVISSNLSKYLNVDVDDTIVCSDGKKEKVYKITGIYDPKPTVEQGEMIYKLAGKTDDNRMIRMGLSFKDGKEGIKKFKTSLPNVKMRINESVISAKYNPHYDRYIFYAMVLLVISICTVLSYVVYKKEEDHIIGVFRAIGVRRKSILSLILKKRVALSFICNVLTTMMSVVIFFMVCKYVLKDSNVGIKSMIFNIPFILMSLGIPVLLSAIFYIEVTLRAKKTPVEILYSDDKRMVRKAYASSCKNVFVRYFKIGMTRSILAILALSIVSGWIYLNTSENKMQEIIYHQYKSFEGEDQDYQLTINSLQNTKYGFDISPLKDVNRKGIEYIQTSRNSYGLVGISDSIKYDEEYFKGLEKSRYAKNVFGKATFKNGNDIIIKSEIIGMDKAFLDSLDMAIADGKIDSDAMEKENLVALYLPTTQDKEKPYVDIKVGDKIDLYVPSNGDASYESFKRDKINSNDVKKTFVVAAILNKAPAMNMVYMGHASIVTYIHINKLNEIYHNSNVRNIKIKYDRNMSMKEKELRFDKDFSNIKAPSMNILDSVKQVNETFSNDRKSSTLKNMVFGYLIVVIIALMITNLYISTIKRIEDYRMIYILGVPARKIKRSVFLENVLSFFISSVAIYFSCVAANSIVMKNYKDTLLKMVENPMEHLSIYMSIGVLIVGLVFSIFISNWVAKELKDTTVSSVN